MKTLGEDSDIVAKVVGVNKEMYFVSTTSGEKKYVLRPELTASVARIALENKWSHSLPKKVWYHGALFRHEKPQHNRYRQFYQLGAEYFGGSTVSSDVDVLFSGLCVLRKLLGQNIELEVQVNCIGDSEARSKYSSALKGWFKSSEVFQRLDPENQGRIETNPLRILDSKTFQQTGLLSSAPRIDSYLTTESKCNFDKVFNELSKLGISCNIVPTLVRGLDYYNDFCFEVKPKAGNEAANKQVTLLAGGRYDTLLGTLTKDPKKNINAVGFAMGIERVQNYRAKLQEEGINLEVHSGPKELETVMLVIGESKNYDYRAIQTRAALQKLYPGLQVDINTTTPGKIGMHLHRLGETHKRVFILGERELEEGFVIERDLVSRIERRISIDKFTS